MFLKKCHGFGILVVINVSSYVFLLRENNAPLTLFLRTHVNTFHVNFGCQYVKILGHLAS